MNSEASNVAEIPKVCDTCGTDQYLVTFYKSNGDEFVPESYRCHNCERASDIADFVSEGYLCSRMVTDIICGHHKDSPPDVISRINKINDEITAFCKQFDSKHWFDGGLQAFIQKQTRRGLSGAFEINGWPIKVMCYSMAGRFVITFQAEKSPLADVTFITAEDSDESRMGVQSFHGNYENILQLCRHAIFDWVKDGVDWDQRLAEDDNVSIL